MARYFNSLRLVALLVVFIATLASTQAAILKAQDLVIRWRDDFRCHRTNQIEEGPLRGQRAECNPNGSNPCCSEFGWCGLSSEYCLCPDCTDYRTESSNLCLGFRCNGKCLDKSLWCNGQDDCGDNSDEVSCCKPPFVERDGKCVMYSNTTLSWGSARQYCEQQGGSLMQFSSLDDLVAFVRNYANDTFYSMGSIDDPFWLDLAAQGNYQDPNSTQWRWMAAPASTSGLTLDSTGAVTASSTATTDITSNSSTGTIEFIKQNGVLIEASSSVTTEPATTITTTTTGCAYLDRGPSATVRQTDDCESLKLPLCALHTYKPPS